MKIWLVIVSPPVSPATQRVGRRHFDMLHAQGPQRIYDGVDDGGGSPGRPRFTDGLHTGRCVGAGNFEDLRRKRRQVVGARQGAIHEGARQQLPRIRVFHIPFKQCLANPLRDAAGQLTLDDHRIQCPADILRHDVVFQGHNAGLRVDLNLGDVAAIGIGRSSRIVAMFHFKAAFCRCSIRNRLRGDLGEAHRSVRTNH